jgi:hypothetical protein
MSKITVYRGTAKSFIYNHPEALTGCTVYFTVKAVVSDSDAADTSAIIKKTILPDAHTDAAAGITGWELSDADTYKDVGSKYHYDIVVEDAAGKSLPPVNMGDFIIKAHPTNRNVGNE